MDSQARFVEMRGGSVNGDVDERRDAGCWRSVLVALRPAKD
jgi:hypothetical protein